jgi:hypothetical protein
MRNANFCLEVERVPKSVYDNIEASFVVRENIFIDFVSQRYLRGIFYDSKRDGASKQVKVLKILECRQVAGSL